jgi:hypothetical protein
VIPSNAAGKLPDNVVTRWFGPAFFQLHPLLQTLHRHGGRLYGDIAVDTGRGLAGLIGRRLARRLGIPSDRARCGFEVQVVHEADALLWRRRFDDGGTMVSRFVGLGHFPAGCWIEQTGPLQLSLGVDIVDGGWHWRLRAARWHGLRVPLALLPGSQAGKRIVDGRYAFEVEFQLPLLGRVLRYGGLLDARAAGS